VNDSDFQQLLASVKEAVRIKRGEEEPARKFEVKAEDKAPSLQKIRLGAFVRIKLHNGPTIDGYAGTNPDSAGLIRVDGLASEDDGA
jgi:hypothetical protein